MIAIIAAPTGEERVALTIIDGVDARPMARVARVTIICRFEVELMLIESKPMALVHKIGEFACGVAAFPARYIRKEPSIGAGYFDGEGDESVGELGGVDESESVVSGQ